MPYPGYPKTLLSPKIHRLVTNGTLSGGIYDLIKFTGDVAADIATIEVKFPGDTAAGTDATALKQVTGDPIEGPFEYVKVTGMTDSTNTDILVYERHNVS